MNWERFGVPDPEKISQAIQFWVSETIFRNWLPLWMRMCCRLFRKGCRWSFRGDGCRKTCYRHPLAMSQNNRASQNRIADRSGDIAALTAAIRRWRKIRKSRNTHGRKRPQFCWTILFACSYDIEICWTVWRSLAKGWQMFEIPILAYHHVVPEHSDAIFAVGLQFSFRVTVVSSMHKCDSWPKTVTK